MNPKSLALGLMIFMDACGFVLADDIPGDCLASLNVKNQMLNVNWILGTGTNASMSCAAGELLRERLFVQGDSMLTEGDLNGSTADKQQDALTAYEDMENKIQQLPGSTLRGHSSQREGTFFQSFSGLSVFLPLRLRVELVGWRQRNFLRAPRISFRRSTRVRRIHCGSRNFRQHCRR